MKVLVVEDEALLAIDLQQSLEAAGYEVIGPAFTLAQALACEDAAPCDVAIADVSLGRETSAPLADRLRARGAPLIVVSGYSRRQLPAAFDHATVLSKPFDMARLLDILQGMSLRLAG